MSSTTPPGGESPPRQPLPRQDELPTDDATNEEFVDLVKRLHNGDLDQSQQVRLGDLIANARELESQSAAVAMMQQVSYQGPLPPPEQLKAYDEETRRIIVQMAVDEQQHAHDMRSKGLDGAIKKDKRGQRYGLTVAVAGLIAAAVIAPFSATAATIIGTLDLAGMVTVFVAPRILERRGEEQPASDDP